MICNKNLSHSIYYSGWSRFIEMLKQKANEYEVDVVVAGRFFSSSKMCSGCGQIKDNLKLADRVYECDCGLQIEWDLNASINLRQFFLESLEYSDNRRGEAVSPIRLLYKSEGSFVEAFTEE